MLLLLQSYSKINKKQKQKQKKIIVGRHLPFLSEHYTNYTKVQGTYMNSYYGQVQILVYG